MTSVAFRECLLFDHQIVEGVAQQCLYFPDTKLTLFSTGEMRRMEQCPAAAKTQEVMCSFFEDHEASDPGFNEMARKHLDVQQMKKMSIASNVVDPIESEINSVTPQVTQSVKKLFKKLAKNGI